MGHSRLSFREAARAGEVAVAHVVAVIAGGVMMAVSIGMGVTIMLLPVGIPLGLVGLGLFLWGIAGFRRASRRRDAP